LGLAFAILGTVTKVPTISWVFLVPLNYAALGAYLAYFLEMQTRSVTRPRRS
jgi:hypothetical protein